MNILTRTKSGALTRISKPSNDGLKGPIILRANRCGNCDQQFSSTRQCTRKFLVTKSAASKNDINTGKNKPNPVPVSVTVNVWAALQEVCEWRFGKENCADVEIHRSVALCSTCGLTLAKLYGAIKSFEDSGVSLSYIGLITQKLRTRFKAQTETESQAEPNANSKTVPLRRRRSSDSSTSNNGEDIEDPVDPCDDPDPDYAPSDAEDFEPPVSARSSKSKKSVAVTQPELDPVLAPPRPIPEEIRVDDTDDEEGCATKGNLCYMCGAGFDKPTNLRRHLLLTHGIGDRSRDFACKICDRAYHFAYLLKNHMDSHSEARPVSCPTPGCDMKFKNGRCLHNHLKHVHRKERPFSCRFCPKRFTVKRDKRVHEAYVHITQKGLKQFDCPHGCGASYKRKQTWITHCKHDCPKRPYGKESEDEVDVAVQSITGDDTGGVKAPRLRKPRPKPTFPCEPECGRVFKCKPSLLGHQQRRCKFYGKNKKQAEESSMSVQVDPPEVAEEPIEPMPSLVLVPVASEFDNHLKPETVIEEPCDLMNIIDQME